MAFRAHRHGAPVVEPEESTPPIACLQVVSCLSFHRPVFLKIEQTGMSEMSSKKEKNFILWFRAQVATTLTWTGSADNVSQAKPLPTLPHLRCLHRLNPQLKADLCEKVSAFRVLFI
jgi:hypothetical protein